MAEASGRSQAGWAFRPGKDYKPMLAIQQAQQQLAKDKQYQAEQEAKKKDQSFKDLENYNKLDKSGLSDQFQKKASDISKVLLESNKEMLLKSGGNLGYEDKFSMMEMQQQSQDDINWMKAIDSDLKNLEANILKQKDLYNAQEAAKFIQDSTKQAFNKDGTLNKNFSVSDIREKLKSPEYINASAAAERFADTIEKQKLDDVDGLEKRKVTQKFAKYNPKTNTFEKDENGNIKVIVSPETVALAKQDELMKTLMDADVKEQKAAGNESYTYSDALGKILKSQQLADVQQTNQRPRANSGSRIDESSYGWNSAQNVQFLESPEEDRFGIKPMEFLANGLKASKNVTLSDADDYAIKGDVQKFTIGEDKEPKIVMSIRGDEPGSAEFVTIPFNELNYKTLLSNAKSDQERKILKQAWQGRNSSTGDVYVNPNIKQGLSQSLAETIKKQATTTFWGAERAYDERSEEEFNQQVQSILSQANIKFDPKELTAEPARYGGENVIMYKGEPYYEDQVNELVNTILKDNKGNSRIFVDSDRYQKIKSQSTPSQESKSAEELSEEERLKKI